ncbi:hypothetical protein GGD50_005485 [Rhizobium paranaense]|uniref:Uncharacterized protein n=1 Tax=Rhizobium paranaense TaxID=1650438 RepID=A0A7W8XWF5_9HYPH|nr:hypothetical protein [Rhizobium paranaense]PST64775.1 hypothetical protein C9E91_00420 [Rhizobium sp. SEMIA4064]
MYKTWRENRPLEGHFPDSFYGFSQIPVFTEEMERQASFQARLRAGACAANCQFIAQDLIES